MKSRIRDILHRLQQGLIEREAPLRLTLLAALAGEHLLIIGPPGTAKSELARRLQRAFVDAQYFERLLTRFSVPEELFGPLSIKALEQDRYERLTESYLPTASIAFIDEIFKANSAILNSLLTLLNEREFDNGHRRIKTPLVAVVAASNELPDSAELDALYDRFLLRYLVEPVSDAGFERLITASSTDGGDIDEALKLGPRELAQIDAAAASVELDDDVVYLLNHLRDKLGAADVYVSDRRWRKAVKLLKVAAATDGRERVDVWDCWLLQHVLWVEPAQREQLLRWYQQSLGTDAVIDPARLGRLADAWQSTLEQEQNHRRHLHNENGEPLYRDPEHGLTTRQGVQVPRERDGAPLYLAPPDQADRSNQGRGYLREELAEQFFDDHYAQCHIDGRWVGLEQYLRDDENRLCDYRPFEPHTEVIGFSAEHIRDRCAEIDALLEDIHRYCAAVSAKLATLDGELASRLWMDPDFAGPAGDTLRHSLGVVEAVAVRLRGLREGFAALPEAPPA